MSAAPVEEFEVGDLDPAGVLAAAAQAELDARRAELRKLQLAYQWAVQHPATGDTGVATWGGPALDVLTSEESLGGDGTPAVAAFTPEPFAAAMQLTPGQGMRLIADALDLRHRLPALVAQAMAMSDPETHQQREDDAQASWDVTIGHPDPTDFTGTSQLTARGDSTLHCSSDGATGAGRVKTHPDNLACLCRRHHRAKTAGLWRYTRTPTGDYLWHGPYGAPDTSSRHPARSRSQSTATPPDACQGVAVGRELAATVY